MYSSISNNAKRILLHPADLGDEVVEPTKLGKSEVFRVALESAELLEGLADVALLPQPRVRSATIHCQTDILVQMPIELASVCSVREVLTSNFGNAASVRAGSKRRMHEVQGHGELQSNCNQLTPGERQVDIVRSPVRERCHISWNRSPQP